jgi:hypothetical protein
MKTKWNFLMVFVLLATLVGGIIHPAQAQEDITGISPAEGTVGTQVTITGAGFGDKHGEVLLGTEKSKVLAWSDTQITFLVDKAQHPDEYAITVLLKSDKKPAEPLTFEAFAIRRPRINSGSTSLIRDGNTVTILGQFFGDKKGVLRVGYETGGERVVEDPKILDWSMNTIRFELPAGLTGGFVLAVRSEVGTSLALMTLDGGVVGSVAPPPGWQGGESWENANGVFYKSLSADDNFYVFSDKRNDGYSDNYLLGASRFTAAEGQFFSISPPSAKTQAPIQPLVVKDSTGNETMWVFYTGWTWAENTCCQEIWYNTYYDNGIQGQWGSFKTIPNVGIYENNTVAPVYDPRIHRISVYYEYDHKLRWVYTDDFGAHWSDDALVGAEAGGIPIKNNFVNAIYWPSAITTALVASTGQVIAVNNGEYRGSIGDLNDDFWRPSLVDLGGETALLYQNHAGGDNTPMMAKLKYATDTDRSWTWTGSTPLVTLPDTGIPLTGYNFQWSPYGAVTKVGDERRLYVFYGVTLWEAYTEETVNRWYLLDKGPVVNSGTLPEIKPTVFSQVSAGEEHACAIKADGRLDCWGNNDSGQLDHPAGTFLQVSAGFSNTCGIRGDHSIACWGNNHDNLVSNRPSGNNFTQVSVGRVVACGLRMDFSVVCWGDSGDGRTIPQIGMTQISSGDWYSCGVRSDGTIACWGDDGGTGRTRPPSLPVGVRYTQVSAGSWHTCGVRSDGTAVCWGDNDKNRVGPVPNLTGLTYKEVSAGGWHTCSLVSNGSIVCWGSDDDRRVSSRPTTGKFTQIEAGIRNTCALRNDGSIVCWGNNIDMQSLPPF